MTTLNMIIKEKKKKVYVSYRHVPISSLTNQEKLFRRREIVRQCQQRYRDRKKSKQQESEERVQDLKNDIAHWYVYQDLLVQGFTTKGSEFNHLHWQNKIIDIFAILLRNGLQPDMTSSERMRQENFFHLSFTKDAIVQSERFPRGPTYLITQHERYAMLYPQLQNRMVEKIAVSANVVLVHMESTLPIKMHTIDALFPHMATHHAFLQIVLEKALVVNARFTLRFNSKNQIEYVASDVDTFGAWMNLIQDPFMVAQMFTPGLVHGTSHRCKEEVGCKHNERHAVSEGETSSKEFSSELENTPPFMPLRQAVNPMSMNSILT